MRANARVTDRAEGLESKVRANAGAQAETEGVIETLTRIVALVRRRAHALHEATGVTTLQLQALHLLRAEGPMGLSELSRRIHLNLSTVSELVDRMSRRRLVRKTRSAEDRRAVEIELGDAARSTLGSLPAAPVSLFRELLAPLSTAEKRELHRLVTKIGARLEQLLGERSPQAAQGGTK